jgi:hypothetical protein
MSKNVELLVEPDSPEARRDFLRKCGWFAAVTPLAIASLLAVASKPTEARASTYGGSNSQGDNNQGDNNQGNNNQGNNNRGNNNQGNNSQGSNPQQ